MADSRDALSSDRSPFRPSRLTPLLKPLQAFLSAESAGGIVLLAATAVALLWANSPWGDSYTHFWHQQVLISAGGFSHAMSFENGVNDGLMALFFLLVGLEIKRELLMGELASARRAALPVAAALGGMVVPALIYAGFNYHTTSAVGWGIPMATDIAFAVGVLALVGRSVPIAVKIFLLAIAIVDDLGAVLVIAIFYTRSISTVALGIAGGFLAALIVLNLLRIHRPLPYLLIGIGLWAAMLASGVHATIAGVLLAFTIPATRRIEEQPYIEHVRELLSDFEHDVRRVPNKITHDQSHALQGVEEASRAVQTPLARVEHALLRPVNFVIMPLFALANAGVDLRHGISEAAHDPAMWGVMFGLLAGKPIGVLLASWSAVKSGIATMPQGATKLHIAGVGILCGIGFTMSLFVANLAFPDDAGHLGAAKLGILVGSILSGVTGALLIASARKIKGNDRETIVG
jgi:NhaA family Na+:H+ antiporter